MTEPQPFVAFPISTRHKVVFFSIISILGTVLYFSTLHSTRFDPTVIPATRLDDLIPFVPSFVVAYISFFVFMPLTLVFIRDLQEFVPASLGFFLILVISNTIFLLWPTVIPHGAPYDPLLHGLFVVDRDRNACPSLHASLALFCALYMQKHTSARLTTAAIWIWAALIIASPLLIKRHMVIDIVAGGALASFMYVAVNALPVRFRQGFRT